VKLRQSAALTKHGTQTETVHRISICSVCTGLLLLISLASPALALSDLALSDLDGRIFMVYSKTGDEVLQADCAVKGQSDLVTCNFIDMRFTLPKPLTDDYALALAEARYEQQPTPALRAEVERQLQLHIHHKELELQKQKTDDPDSIPLTQEVLKEDRESLVELQKNPSKFIKDMQLPELFKVSPNDPALNARLKGEPPKLRQYLTQIMEALSAKDAVKSLELYKSMQLRTCGAFMMSFSLDFKRLGKFKWLSEGEPQGLCKIVRVYELERDPSSVVLWTLTQRNIAVGNTDVSLCKQFAKAEEELPVEVFSSKNSSEFELPCDWVDWLSP
jgi:hypothetical protein